MAKADVASPPDWRFILTRLPLIFLSALIVALAVVLFLRPAQLAPGGLSGIGIILNATFNIPIGLVAFIGNVIVLSIGYRYLGGINTVIMTVIFAVIFSLIVDSLGRIVPPNGLSDDRLLNALYGGVVGGIGGGLVYRVGGTMGGSSVLSRIVNSRLGIPISSSYLYVDSLVIISAGLVFGWEASLFSMIALVVDGFVADYVLEGPSIIRTATIITDKPDEVSDTVLYHLQRGVTSWEGVGRYTGQSHSVLFVTIGRSQVSELRALVSAADPNAFVVIGQAHVAYGSGFREVNTPKKTDF